jgi:hypothetical protein
VIQILTLGFKGPIINHDLHRANNTNDVSSLSVCGPNKACKVFWKVTLCRCVNTFRRFPRQQCLRCRGQAASLFFDYLTLTTKARRSFQTPLNHRVPFVAVQITTTTAGAGCLCVRSGCCVRCGDKIKFTLGQTTKAQTGSRDIALLFL